MLLFVIRGLMPQTLGKIIDERFNIRAKAQWKGLIRERKDVVVGDKG